VSLLQPPKKAVFLDRDGTLIKLVDYLNRVEQVRLEATAGEAVRKLNDANFKVMVITNQSAISRKRLNLEELNAIHQRINDLLQKATESHIDGFYFCPHHPDDYCDCRIPKPTLLLEAAEKHNIDLKQSYLIGDYRTDILAGINAGCKTVLALSGYGKTEVSAMENWMYRPDFVAVSLLDAVEWILEKSQKISGSTD
jgi:histidinol-phosphate phosphatase family protein